jgi:hypothetical protein
MVVISILLVASRKKFCPGYFLSDLIIRGLGRELDMIVAEVRVCTKLQLDSPTTDNWLRRIREELGVTGIDRLNNDNRLYSELAPWITDSL